ncbi:hypothetical protein T492DRAFT_1116189 [Pavlovales sp. CCMP2436]|nr:hypothetical protein T492DRAFT_1116189 [Pavlovales sp. CCMP2436]
MSVWMFWWFLTKTALPNCACTSAFAASETGALVSSTKHHAEAHEGLWMVHTFYIILLGAPLSAGMLEFTVTHLVFVGDTWHTRAHPADEYEPYVVSRIRAHVYSEGVSIAASPKLLCADWIGLDRCAPGQETSRTFAPAPNRAFAPSTKGRLPNGMSQAVFLLVGPPGVGKTTFGVAVLAHFRPEDAWVCLHHPGAQQIRNALCEGYSVLVDAPLASRQQRAAVINTTGLDECTRFFAIVFTAMDWDCIARVRSRRRPGDSLARVSKWLHQYEMPTWGEFTGIIECSNDTQADACASWLAGQY